MPRIAPDSFTSSLLVWAENTLLGDPALWTDGVTVLWAGRALRYLSGQ
jgi:hypothetical protein